MTIPTLIIALVFGVAGLHAQFPRLPKALMTAKTAYVVNSGAYADAKKDCTAELAKWGRFKVVDSESSSDITISLSKPRPFEGLPMTVYDSKTDAKFAPTAAGTRKASRPPCCRVPAHLAAYGSMRAQGGLSQPHPSQHRAAHSAGTRASASSTRR